MQQERLHVWAKVGDEEGRPNGGDFPMRIQFSSFALGLALSTVVGAARADVIVTGTLDHLHIEASRAPIVEVLEALKKQFGIVYQFRTRLDWTVDGAFAGSLSSIFPQFFRDKDYVFRIEANHSVTVFFASLQGPPPVHETSQPPPVQARDPISQPSFCAPARIIRREGKRRACSPGRKKKRGFRYPDFPRQGNAGFRMPRDRIRDRSLVAGTDRNTVAKQGPGSL